jgi:two-component system cell cycle sensor histidine kinase/response regulator CckA
VPESEMTATMAIIEDLIANGTSHHGYETKRYAKDGRLLDVSISASRYNDHEDNPAGMLVTIRDISENKRLEAQFQRAQKMEAIATLAGGVAHDFNNILMAMLGRTSIMLMDKNNSHPEFEHLKAMEKHIESAADLTKQLLGFARGGKYEVKPTDLNELIKAQNRMFGQTKKEITIRGKYQDDIWIIEADQGQVNQVLMNLYINAWQAMPGGGDLYVQTENVVIDDDLAKTHQIPPGRYVKVSVTDTGIGMDSSVKDKIFDPFFTTKEMGIGTGLGLASAYGIIKNHGGCINVYSEKGHGSTFSIYLPAIKVEGVAQPAESDTRKGIVKGNETILLVDDEDMIVEIVGDCLEQLGYKILVARSGKEAIDIYRNHMEQIDLVLLDMIMPDMSGGDVYDRLKEINPAIKTLLATGYSLNGQAAEILNRGCNGFIQKPANIQELSKKLREILSNK